MFYHHNVNNIYCELQDYLEGLDVDGNIILNRSSINWMMGGRDRIRRLKDLLKTVMKLRVVQFCHLPGIS